MTTSKINTWATRLLLFVAVLYGSTQLISVASGRKQHDFRTYYNAAEANNQGLDPYSLDSLRLVSGDDQAKLPFVYPPHCLAIFKPFTTLGYTPAYYLYLSLKLAALLLLIIIWVRIVPPDKLDWTAICITVMLGYRSAVLRDLKAGNVSTFEQLVFWGGILLVMRNKSVLGGLGILLSSAFKLVTVALVPVIILIRRTWQSLAVSSILVLGGITGYVMLYYANTAQWRSFINAASLLDERGNRNPSSMAFLLDVGDAIGINEFSVYTVYAILCCIVLAILVWAFIATRHSKDIYPMLYLAILGYVILAPRMKDYSLMIALLPALHTISAMTTRRWLSLIGAVLLWIPLIKYQSLLLSAFAFFLILSWIWNYRKDPNKRVELTLDPLRGFSEAHP